MLRAQNSVLWFIENIHERVRKTWNNLANTDSKTVTMVYGGRWIGVASHIYVYKIDRCKWAQSESRVKRDHPKKLIKQPPE